jgi:hypothetical protein
MEILLQNYRLEIVVGMIGAVLTLVIIKEVKL